MSEKKERYRGFTADGTPQEQYQYPNDEERVGVTAPALGYDHEHDVFGNEAGHSIQYKTLSWQMVVVLMIAEIVSNGMLSLPSSAGVVGVSDFDGL